MEEYLSTEGIYNSIAGIWNKLIDAAWSLLTLTPQGDFSGAYNLAMRLFDALLPVAVGCLCLFFCISYFKETMDIRRNMTLESCIVEFIKLIVANSCILYISSWIPRFISWARDLVGLVTRSADGHISGSDLLQMEDASIGDLLFLWILGVLLLLVTVVMGCLVVTPVISRIPKLILLMPLSGVALSTIVGGQGLSRTASSWIREFLGTSFEVFGYAIVLAISSSFIGFHYVSYATSDPSIADCILSAVNAVIGMMVVVGSMKGADTVFKKGLGL